MCGIPGHSFNDCPLLNDIPFLKQHFIKCKLNASRFVCDCNAHGSEAKLPSAAVNHVAADTDDESVDTQDFHQGQE